ncbi:MAG TPA: hypothetical protein DIW47_09295 [Bacteroidetes bacterium]|nr:hypothetical protein [Bacteroidota bacterium]
MKVKASLFLLFFLVTSYTATCQIIRINNQCNPLIGSLEQVVYIVRQDYALKGSDGVLYGQNNQEYFGYRYGPAIVWNGQLYVSPVTYYAHLRDTSATNYGAEYVPVPTTTSFKHVAQDLFTKIDPEALKATPEKATVVMTDSMSGSQPVGIESISTKKTLLVTFECRDVELSDSSRFKLNFLYAEIIREPNGKMHIKETSMGNAVRFALVFDEITEIGVARLEFRGFAETMNGAVQINPVKVEDAPETNNNGKSRKK